MKNNVLMVTLLLLVTACSSNHSPATTTKADTLNKKTAATQYTCTMHPEVIASKPGTCPKCGMDLVEKDKTK